MRWRKTLGLVDLGFEEKRKVNWGRKRELQSERESARECVCVCVKWMKNGVFFFFGCLYYFNGLASYIYILKGFRKLVIHSENVKNTPKLIR